MSNNMINPEKEQDRTAPFPGPNARQRPQPYQFTADEMRVLRECNKESFFGRSLPFGAVLGGLTYYGVHTGIFSRSRNFGAVPKVTAAIITGYLLGKFSYHQKCAEKFMALPDSKVGRIMKARRLGIPDDEVDPPPGFSLNPFGGISPDSYSDIPEPNKSYDHDSRPSHEGLDDSFRPSMDNPIILHEEEMPPEQKHVTTYDELRKQNREEYEHKKIDHYRQLLPRRQSQPTPTKQSEFSDPADYKKPIGSEPKNKYGDIWG